MVKEKKEGRKEGRKRRKEGLISTRGNTAAFDEVVFEDTSRNEGLFQEDFADGTEDDGDIFTVGSTSTMNVDSAVFAHVEKLFFDVFNSRTIFFTAFVLGGTPRKIDLFNLDSEEIFFVEEEDDGSVFEPGTVDQISEKGKGLVHTLDVGIFAETHVVFGERDKENDGGHVLEAVEPFSALGPLPSDINDIDNRSRSFKFEFNQTSGSRAHVYTIISVGNIPFGRETTDIFKTIFSRIGELQLCSTFVGLLDRFAFPKIVNNFGHVFGEFETLQV